MKQINGYVGLSLSYNHMAKNLNGHTLDQIINDPSLGATKDEKTLATILKMAREGKALNKPICIFSINNQPYSPTFVPGITSFSLNGAQWIGLPLDLVFSGEESRIWLSTLIGVRSSDGVFGVTEI